MGHIDSAYSRRVEALRAVCATFAVLLLATVAHPSRASGQDRFSGEGFTPAAPLPDSIVGVWGSATLEPLKYSLALDGSYARRPLAVSSHGETVADLVGSIGTLELMGSLGLLDRLDLSVALPVHRVSAGSSLEPSAPAALRDAVVDKSQAGFGDIRVTPRFRFFGPTAGKHGLGLALLVPVFVPTGKDSLSVGEDLRVEPKLAVEFATRGAVLAANAGYLVRSKVELLGANIDDMVTWGIGGAWQLIDPLWLAVEFNGRINVFADNFGWKDTPTELLAALRIIQGRFLGQLGAGPGLAGGISEPSWRILGAVSLLPEGEPSDADRDGLIDERDRCPSQSEDRDGFEDDDGCPDPDNDHDGLTDREDHCPNDAEDRDGFLDQDGCPDLDNDNDGVADQDDACRNTPGVASSDAAKNGCPSDRDDDQIIDALDACPDTRGEASSDTAKNGCPKIVDRDGDGVLDTDDACPDSAGELHPDSTKNGCPKARVEAGQIKIIERVEFVSGSAKLAPSSTPILEAVRKVLDVHSEIAHLSIEGHTDDRGANKRNQKLSQQRAETVMKWFVKNGVAADRLEAHGFGEDRPIESNATPEGRALNRRVEFQIR